MGIIVSMSVHRGILSVLIMEDGTLCQKVVKRISEDNAYLSSIKAFDTAISIVRGYLQITGIRKPVYFETSSSVLIKWVQNQYSKKNYQKEFRQVMESLNSLPIQYEMIYNTNPKARVYAEEKYIQAKAMSSLDIEEGN